MPINSTKTYLLSFNHVSINKFLDRLINNNIKFEILNPKELNGQWNNVYFRESVAISYKEQLTVLDSVLQKKPQKKGFINNFVDDRYEASFDEILNAEQNKDEILQLAKNINSYSQLSENKNELAKFTDKYLGKSLFFGLDLFQNDIHIQQEILKFMEDSGVNLSEDPISINGIQTDHFESYDVVICDPKDQTQIEDFIQAKFGDKLTFSVDQLYQSITDQLNNLNQVLSAQQADPDNIFEGVFKQFAALYSYYELSEKAGNLSRNIFSLEENSPAKFAFISVIESQNEKMKEILSDLMIAFEETEWNKEIVNWDNPQGLKSFQDVAQAIGTIGKKESDPTGVLAVFFMIFFAFCLGDAIYGLVLSGFTGYLLFFKKLKPGFKNMFSLFFYSGLVTILFGMLTNSWAGDIFNSNLIKKLIGTEAQSTGINNILKNFQLIDILNANADAPVNLALKGTSPIIVMMGVAIFLGFTNQLVAYLLKINTSIRNGKYGTAFSQFSWIFFLVTVIFAIASNAANGNLSGLPLVLLGLGIIGLLVFNEAKSIFGKLIGGLIGSPSVYGLIALISDMMSFTRIVAVGLTGGVIASIVNLLAGLVYEASGPVLGIVFAIIILLVGHIFNFVLSVFGAYINPLRLTYVEFMPKFFEGQGRQLMAVSPEFKYLRVVS